MPWMILDILFWMMHILQNRTHQLEEAPMKVEGSVALVTGANRGIRNAGSAGLLSGVPAKVSASGRDATRCATGDPRLVPVQLDVTSAAKAPSVPAALGDVEIVVINA